MEKVKAARLSILSNASLVVGKVVVGLSINSVSVLAEAIHSTIDLLAAVIAFFSVREASKPADEDHPFGHGKYENVSGVVEALLIFVAAGWIIYEATRRLFDGGVVTNALPGLIVMGLSAGINWFVSAYLMRTAEATDSVALRADAMHLRTDVYSSLGVFGSLLVISLTGIQTLDPIVAMGVALLILKAAWELTRDSLLPLLDVSLPPAEQKTIRNVLARFEDRYLEVHTVRSRKSGAERHVDLNLVLPRAAQLSDAHILCDEIEAAMKEALPNSTILIHVEPCDSRGWEKCNENCKVCYPTTNFKTGYE